MIGAKDFALRNLPLTHRCDGLYPIQSKDLMEDVLCKESKLSLIRTWGLMTLWQSY